MDRLRRLLFRLVVPVNRRLYELSGGRVGGRMGNAPILLLRVRGRRSGKLRVTPLLYLAREDGYLVVASAGGAPRHPAWFLNLQASPEAEVQLGRERLPVTAREASAGERERLWPELVAMWPSYAEYQTRTQRVIPVVILQRRSS